MSMPSHTIKLAIGVDILRFKLGIPGIEFSRDEATQIKITLSLLNDYSKRHDELLATLARDLAAIRLLSDRTNEKLEQELRNRVQNDAQITNLLSKLPEAYQNIAVLKEHQFRNATRMNIIVGSFWSAIAVIAIGIFQEST